MSKDICERCGGKLHWCACDDRDESNNKRIAELEAVGAKWSKKYFDQKREVDRLMVALTEKIIEADTMRQHHANAEAEVERLREKVSSLEAYILRELSDEIDEPAEEE